MAAKKTDKTSRVKKPIVEKTPQKTKPAAPTAAVKPPSAKPAAAKPAAARPAAAKPAIAKPTTAEPTAAKATTRRNPTAKPAEPIVIPSPSGAGRPNPVVTTIVAQIDTGFGNELFIRGAGGDLSWETGVPMECVGPDRWRFATTAAEEDLLEVKFLLNDRTWCRGDNIVVPVGVEFVVKPGF